MKTLTYEVTNPSNGLTKTMAYEAVRVMINSNSRDKMMANFKKLDDLKINEAIDMTDNYGSLGGGAIVIERVA